MPDISTPDDIKTMVNLFYEEVKKDDLLGGIFHQVIGNNWDTHLEKMYRFWEQLLLHTPVYYGRPFDKHVDLPVKPEHFERWIGLFNKTINNRFSGPNAELAKERASSIAEIFMHKLFTNNPSLNIH